MLKRKYTLGSKTIIHLYINVLNGIVTLYYNIKYNRLTVSISLSGMTTYYYNKLSRHVRDVHNVRYIYIYIILMANALIVSYICIRARN